MGDIGTAASCTYSRAQAVICLRALTVFIVSPHQYRTVQSFYRQSIAHFVLPEAS